jgi:hypothetical protein
MNFRLSAWGAKKIQGASWMIVGLALVIYSYYEPDYRYVWLVIGFALAVYGNRIFRKTETPFERRQRELRRTQL